MLQRKSFAGKALRLRCLFPATSHLPCCFGVPTWGSGPHVSVSAPSSSSPSPHTQKGRRRPPRCLPSTSSDRSAEGSDTATPNEHQRVKRSLQQQEGSRPCAPRGPTAFGRLASEGGEGLSPASGGGGGKASGRSQSPARSLSRAEALGAPPLPRSHLSPLEDPDGTWGFPSICQWNWGRQKGRKT